MLLMREVETQVLAEIIRRNHNHIVAIYFFRCALIADLDRVIESMLILSASVTDILSYL